MPAMAGLGVRGVAAAASGYEPTSAVAVSAGPWLLRLLKEAGVGYSPHPAENFQQPFLCSPSAIWCVHVQLVMLSVGSRSPRGGVNRVLKLFRLNNKFSALQP